MLREYLAKEMGEELRPYFLLSIIRILLFGRSSRRAVAMYRIASHLHKNGYRRLSYFIFRRLETKYGFFVSPTARIDKGLKLPHPTGIVIGAGVEIGKNCTIYQQVTLGGKKIGDAAQGRYPRIGDNVVLYAGAKVLGGVSVGSNSQVGANSVLTRSIAEKSVAAGVPAKVIGSTDTSSNTGSEVGARSS